MADTGVPSPCGGGADLPLLGNLPMLTYCIAKAGLARVHELEQWEFL